MTPNVGQAGRAFRVGKNLASSGTLWNTRDKQGEQRWLEKRQRLYSPPMPKRCLQRHSSTKGVPDEMEGVSRSMKHRAEEGHLLIQRVLDSGRCRRALARTRHVTSYDTEPIGEGLHQGSPLPGGTVPCVNAYHGGSDPCLPKIRGYRVHRASLPAPQRSRSAAAKQAGRKPAVKRSAASRCWASISMTHGPIGSSTAPLRGLTA
jgi:hypothetical protein